MNCVDFIPRFANVAYDRLSEIQRPSRPQSLEAKPVKRLTQDNYTKDKLYPVVARAISELLKRSNYVAPVEVLLQLQRITKQQYEDWRFGRIGYLERVTLGGLGKMSRILRIIELHCQKLNLKPSNTIYRKWGKGGKRITLRFSKSGRPKLEAAYSRHYVATTEHPFEP